MQKTQRTFTKELKGEAVQAEHPRGDGAMHDLWKGIKRQQMFFIFTQATDRFGIAQAVFRGSRRLN